MYRTLLIGMGCCAALAAQPGSKSNWSVQAVRVGTLKGIEADWPKRLAPDAGSTIVEVIALVRSADAHRLLIPVGAVFLQTAQGAKSDLAAVGVVYKPGDPVFRTGPTVCVLRAGKDLKPAPNVNVYELTGGHGSAAFEVGVGSARSGFKLGRKTDGEPLAITIEKNPEQLCFAFIVPESAKGALMTLRLEDATAAVRLP